MTRPRSLFLTLSLLALENLIYPPDLLYRSTQRRAFIDRRSSQRRHYYIDIRSSEWLTLVRPIVQTSKHNHSIIAAYGTGQRSDLASAVVRYSSLFCGATRQYLC